jgi:DNA-directed RNA polymerase specialized sigma24 family protein
MVESREVDETLNGPDDREYNVHDIEYLYSCRTLLSPRQRQAIELCLYENYKEKEAARIMGVSETNPVAMYATDGLRKLCDLIAAGELTRYSEREYADRGIV